MTDNIKLPPLPEKVVISTHLPTGVSIYGYTADQMQAYASEAVKLNARGSRATTHAAVCWSWGPKHYECAVREIKALRAKVGELHMHAKRRDQYAVEKAAQALDWKKRAEQLLEALKKVAQALEWYAHGRCRGFDVGAPLPTNEAVELAERTIAKALGHDDSATAA